MLQLDTSLQQFTVTCIQIMPICPWPLILWIHAISSGPCILHANVNVLALQWLTIECIQWVVLLFLLYCLGEALNSINYTVLAERQDKSQYHKIWTNTCKHDNHVSRDSDKQLQLIMEAIGWKWVGMKVSWSSMKCKIWCIVHEMACLIF